MGGLSCRPLKRYSISFNGSKSIVLRSKFRSTSALTIALLAAMKSAPLLQGGGYDIAGITCLFSEYKDVVEWPLHYQKKICDAVNVLQFRLCLPSTVPTSRYSRDVCTVDVGTSQILIRVSAYCYPEL